MVLNDSSLYTHNARKEILDSFLGFDGAMQKHIFIGLYYFQLKNLTPVSIGFEPVRIDGPVTDLRSNRGVGTDCD